MNYVDGDVIGCLSGHNARRSNVEIDGSVPEPVQIRHFLVRGRESARRRSDPPNMLALRLLVHAERE